MGCPHVKWKQKQNIHVWCCTHKPRTLSWFTSKEQGWLSDGGGEDIFLFFILHLPPDAKNWHWKRPWYWERLKAGGEGYDRGWDVASPTRWTWVWASSGSWWWTGKPIVLQSMGSQSWTRLSDWTELDLLQFVRFMEHNKLKYKGEF